MLNEFAKVYVCFFLFALFSQAIADEKPLLIVSDPWPPYVIRESGPYQGSDVDVIAATFKTMGIPIRIEFYPWQRCLSMIEHKKADAILSAAKTFERHTTMYFPDEPVSKGNTVFFIKKGRSIPYQSLSDLDQLRAGAVTGFKYCDAIDKSTFMMKAERVNTIEQNFVKLLADRIDFSVGEKAVGFYKAKLLGISDEIDIIPNTSHCPDGNFLAFSKQPGHDALAEKFGRALRAFKHSDQYPKVLQRYGM